MLNLEMDFVAREVEIDINNRGKNPLDILKVLDAGKYWKKAPVLYTLVNFSDKNGSTPKLMLNSLLKRGVFTVEEGCSIDTGKSIALKERMLKVAETKGARSIARSGLAFSDPKELLSPLSFQ